MYVPILLNIGLYSMLNLKHLSQASLIYVVATDIRQPWCSSAPSHNWSCFGTTGVMLHASLCVIWCQVHLRGGKNEPLRGVKCFRHWVECSCNLSGTWNGLWGACHKDALVLISCHCPEAGGSATPYHTQRSQEMYMELHDDTTS